MQTSTNALGKILPIAAAARIEGAEERSIVIDGVGWRYLHAGSGPPLLLIHGLMGYSFSWRFVMRGLAQYFSVYAVDLPGTGFSERFAGTVGSLTSDAEGLLKFMDALAIEDTFLLGTSRGGGLSIILAALAKKRGRPTIRKLILSAPVNPWSKFGQARARMLATYLGGLCAVHLIPRMPFLLKKYFTDLYGDTKRIPPDSFSGYELGLMPPGSFQHVSRMMQPWIADLQRIGSALSDLQELPILLLWGTHDRAVHPASAYELQTRLKNSTVVMMDGIGHMPYEEGPEEFNRIVVDFLLHDRPPTRLQTSRSEMSAVEEPVKDGSG